MNLKTTLLLALAGLVAAVLLLVAEKPWKKDEPATAKKPETGETALFEKAPEAIDRVEMTLKEGRRVFKKEGDDWQITEPIEAPAKDYEVKSIIDAITGLKYGRAYAKDDKARPPDSVSGLNKPTVVKLFKGDKLEAGLEVGASLFTGKGNYIRLAGSEDVRESKSDLHETFNKRLDTFRDKRVVKFETKDAQRVTIEGPQNCVLVRSGDNWLMESPVRARVDKAKADALVQQLSALYADDWQKDDPKSYAIYQLDPPRLKLTAQVRRAVPAKCKPGDAAATRPADTQPSTELRDYTVMIGGTTGASSPVYFARLASRPWVFSLNENKVKPLSVPVSDLQDKTLAKVEPAKVKKINVQASGESMALAKGVDNKWMFADGTAADPAAVEDLIKAVADMKATAFADADSALLVQDWSKPRAKVSLTQEGQLEPVTLLVGNATPSGRMVYVRNAAEQPVAAVNEDLVAPLLLPPVSYRDRLVLSVPRERLSKIEIQRPDAPAVTLVKQGPKWSMQAPLQAAADADAVRNLVGDLSALQAKRVAGTGDKAKFGLDKPEVTLAVWVDRLTDLPNTQVVGAATQPATTQPAAISPPSTQPATTQPADLAKRIATVETLLEYQRTHPETENKKATEMLQQQLAELKAQQATTQPALAAAATQPAKAATTQPAAPELRRILMARKDGKVYAALENGPMIWELDKRIYDDTTAEMHDHQIAKFEVANVADVSFGDPKAALTFRKMGEDWRYVPDPLLPVDKQKVTDLLNAFREIKTHRYVDYAAADLAKYGLGDDAERLVVSLDNGQRTEIRLSKTGPADDPDKSRYGVVAGTNKVFLLKEDQTKKFSQKLADFEKTEKPGANPAPTPSNFSPTFSPGPADEPPGE